VPIFKGSDQTIDTIAGWNNGEKTGLQEYSGQLLPFYLQAFKPIFTLPICQPTVIGRQFVMILSN
jgi:hypothetical protein